MSLMEKDQLLSAARGNTLQIERALAAACHFLRSRSAAAAITGRSPRAYIHYVCSPAQQSEIRERISKKAEWQRLVARGSIRMITRIFICIHFNFRIHRRAARTFA